MVQRYISAEQSIAAAGAAFACMDDDCSDIAKARQAASTAQQFWGTNLFARLWKLLGFKDV